MNQFDNEVSSTLKEIAERVETPPYLKDRIDKELLRRCPEYRKKIAVIFGGCSPEYSVSLQSAYAVISHMDTEVYTPVLIGISQSGDWFLYEEGTAIPAVCTNLCARSLSIHKAEDKTPHPTTGIPAISKSP